jgi:predicted GNAT family acetyltransferase
MALPPLIDSGMPTTRCARMDIRGNCSNTEAPAIASPSSHRQPPRSGGRQRPAGTPHEPFLDGRRIGLLAYRQRDNRVAFTHTEVSPACEGRGRQPLAAAALDDARRQDLVVVPLPPSSPHTSSGTPSTATWSPRSTAGRAVDRKRWVVTWGSSVYRHVPASTVRRLSLDGQTCACVLTLRGETEVRFDHRVSRVTSVGYCQPCRRLAGSPQPRPGGAVRQGAAATGRRPSVDTGIPEATPPRQPRATPRCGSRSCSTCATRLRLGSAASGFTGQADFSEAPARRPLRAAAELVRRLCRPPAVAGLKGSRSIATA